MIILENNQLDYYTNEDVRRGLGALVGGGVVRGAGSLLGGSLGYIASDALGVPALIPVTTGIIGGGLATQPVLNSGRILVADLASKSAKHNKKKVSNKSAIDRIGLLMSPNGKIVITDKERDVLNIPVGTDINLQGPNRNENIKVLRPYYANKLGYGAFGQSLSKSMPVLVGMMPPSEVKSLK